MIVCKQCGKPEDFQNDSKSELRPYGPGGTYICYHCAFESGDEVKQSVENAFHARLDAAEAISPVVLLGGPTGPEPYIEGTND